MCVCVCVCFSCVVYQCLFVPPIFTLNPFPPYWGDYNRRVLFYCTVFFIYTVESVDEIKYLLYVVLPSLFIFLIFTSLFQHLKSLFRWRPTLALLCTFSFFIIITDTVFKWEEKMRRVVVCAVVWFVSSVYYCEAFWCRCETKWSKRRLPFITVCVYLCDIRVYTPHPLNPLAYTVYYFYVYSRTITSTFLLLLM